MPPSARRSFRVAALGTAIVCFLLAFIIRALAVPSGSFSCLILGFVMLAIYTTGTWPPRG